MTIRVAIQHKTSYIPRPMALPEEDVCPEYPNTLDLRKQSDRVS